MDPDLELAGTPRSGMIRTEYITWIKNPYLSD